MVWGMWLRIGVAALFACGARSNQVDELGTGRHMLMETAGSMSSTPKFDAEALRSDLAPAGPGAFEAAGSPPTGDYTLKVLILTQEELQFFKLLFSFCCQSKRILCPTNGTGVSTTVPSAKFTTGYIPCACAACKDNRISCVAWFQFQHPLRLSDSCLHTPGPVSHASCCYAEYGRRHQAHSRGPRSQGNARHDSA